MANRIDQGLSSRPEGHGVLSWRMPDVREAITYTNTASIYNNGTSEKPKQRFHSLPTGH